MGSDESTININILPFAIKGCLFLDLPLLHLPEDPVKTPRQERRQEPAEISESTKYSR